MEYSVMSSIPKQVLMGTLKDLKYYVKSSKSKTKKTMDLVETL